MTVTSRYLYIALIFSLMARFSFHLYQGLASAAVITTLGISYLAWYWWLNGAKFHHDDMAINKLRPSLLPFMLSHSYFDVFGLGFPYQLFIH